MSRFPSFGWQLISEGSGSGHLRISGLKEKVNVICHGQGGRLFSLTFVQVCSIIKIESNRFREPRYMGMANKIHVRPAGLYVSVTGEFTLDDARRTFLEIVQYVDENQIDKVLFDGSKITGDPTVIDRFYYGEFAAHAVQRLKDNEKYAKEPYFAYILHEPVADPGRFGETVAINRGMNVKVHETIDSALEWLGVTADDLLVDPRPLERAG